MNTASEAKGEARPLLSPWLSGYVNNYCRLRFSVAAIPAVTHRISKLLRLGLEPRESFRLPFGLLFCYTKIMKRTRNAKQKVLGRPRTGITPLMGFRADARTRAAIVKWAEAQADRPSLSEAIRRLVEMGLKAKPK
jgi:hypothetical protein